MGQPKIPQKIKESSLKLAIPTPQLQLLKNLESKKCDQIRKTRDRATEIRERDFFDRIVESNTKDLAQNQEGIVDTMGIQEKEFQILSLGVERLAAQLQIMLDHFENFKSEISEILDGNTESEKKIDSNFEFSNFLIKEDLVPLEKSQEKFIKLTDAIQLKLEDTKTKYDLISNNVSEISEHIESVTDQSKKTFEQLNGKINDQFARLKNLNEGFEKFSFDSNQAMNFIRNDLTALEKLLQNENLNIQAININLLKQKEDFQILKNDQLDQRILLNQEISKTKKDYAKLNDELLQLRADLQTEKNRTKKILNFQLVGVISFLVILSFLLFDK